jgi:hypothetical protein
VRASVPFMITNSMKAELRDLGLTDSEIANLTPADAHELLGDGGAMGVGGPSIERDR